MWIRMLPTVGHRAFPVVQPRRCGELTQSLLRDRRFQISECADAHRSQAFVESARPSIVRTRSGRATLEQALFGGRFIRKR